MSDSKVQPCWPVNRKFLVLGTGGIKQNFGVGVIFVLSALQAGWMQLKICIDLMHFENTYAFIV